MSKIEKIQNEIKKLKNDLAERITKIEEEIEVKTAMFFTQNRVELVAVSENYVTFYNDSDELLEYEIEHNFFRTRDTSFSVVDLREIEYIIKKALAETPKEEE